MLTLRMLIMPMLQLHQKSNLQALQLQTKRKKTSPSLTAQHIENVTPYQASDQVDVAPKNKQ